MRHTLRSSLVYGAVVAGAACLGTSLVQAQSVFHHYQGTLRGGVSQGGVILLEDLNGDGVEDYLFGSVDLDRHFVVSGTDWSMIANVHAPSPTQSHAGHGSALARAGDWDGDGIGDYAVGAPGYSPVMWSFEGIVRVYSGATHTQLAEMAVHVPLTTLGARVFGLGDINGDGQPEIAVTAEPTADIIRIYSAPNGDLLRTHNNLGYDYHVETYGDWDGDGCPDYMINNMTSNAGPSSGSVWLYSGATGLPLLIFEGTRPYDLVGISFSKAGDWNADGVEDVVAGAPGWGAPDFYASTFPMAVYVYSGADASILRTFEGLDFVPESANFGYSVDSGYDVNGDGYPDLIVGAPNEGRGAVYVLSGRSGAVLWRVEGHPPQFMIGEYVRFLPDRNGDGLAEWLIVDPDLNREDSSFTIYEGAVGDRREGCGALASARLFAAGPIGLRENGLQFSVESAAPDSVGLLLSGNSGPAVPFGQGRLCLGGSQVRVAQSATDGSGNAFLPLDLHQPPFGQGANQLLPGDIRAFQFLYRDSATLQPDASNSIVIQFLP